MILSPHPLHRPQPIPSKSPHFIDHNQLQRNPQKMTPLEKSSFHCHTSSLIMLRFTAEIVILFTLNNWQIRQLNREIRWIVLARSGSHNVEQVEAKNVKAALNWVFS